MTKECDVPFCDNESEYYISTFDELWEGVVCKECVFEMFEPKEDR